METLLALLTVISLLSAITMAAFAWKINSDWCLLVRELNRYWRADHESGKEA